MTFAISAMHTSSSGETPMRAALESTSAQPRRLRNRELLLLSALATGAPITAVATHLGVSDRTIRRRIRLVCAEIGVSTPIEAVAWAARRRLI
jgi:DNA-binding NarL/FixJ family response regulator